MTTAKPNLTLNLLALLTTLILNACSPVEPEVLVVDRRPHPDHGIYLLQAERRSAIFAAQPLGHLLQIAYSKARGECVFAYNPPPVPGASPVLQTSLYRIPVEPSNPAGVATPSIMIPANRNEVLLDPVFSPDSKQLYWVRAGQLSTLNNTGSVSLNVTDLATMTHNKVLDNAIWPAPSPNGEKLAFVAVDPQTLARGLSVLEPSSGAVSPLIEIGLFDDVDAPLFSPDNQWIYFFGPAAPQTGWLEWLGISSAQAHINRPGVWWKISVTGEGLQPVTADTEIISNATRSASGVLTYTSSLGVRLLSRDGARTLYEGPYFGGVAEYVQ